ncbi:hypothetical protein KTU01_34100 [Kocuria turfanensis]|uniref:Uncharacterized protein n=1 Tax=Kocuria turfanensis TaxID=388357 RepID=A0A512IHZ4_9MICC|nr:hypothetical protein KTU01_34100 [Kocuria turfanensis]
MCTWTVAATRKTSVRAEGPLAQSLMQALTVYDGGLGSYGPGGVSLTMHVEASIGATAYVAALSALATDALPWAAGADLTDPQVSAPAHRWQGLNALLPGRPTPTSRRHPAPAAGPPPCPQEGCLGSSGPRGEKPEAPHP